jgi:hypothetical protein
MDPTSPDRVAEPAAPSSHLRVLAVAVAAAVLLLAIGIAVGVAFARDGGWRAVLGLRPSESPLVVAGHYLDQMAAGNVSGADALVCKAERGRNGQPAAIGLRLAGLVKYEIGDEHITDTTATVDVNVTVPVIGRLTFAIRLVEEAGQWRVCGGDPA